MFEETHHITVGNHLRLPVLLAIGGVPIVLLAGGHGIADIPELGVFEDGLGLKVSQILADDDLYLGASAGRRGIDGEEFSGVREDGVLVEHSIVTILLPSLPYPPHLQPARRYCIGK